jgi:hypothetical protein
LTLPKALSLNSLHLMVSRSYPASARLLVWFNATLEAIRKNGVYGGILRKHNISQ